MSDLKTAKEAARKVLNEKLNVLTTEEVERQSKEVEKRVLAHPLYQASKRLTVYLCMPKEIQTTGILRHALDSGKTVYIPRYKTKSNFMDMVRLHSWEEYEALPVTRWNIKQPPMSQDCETALASGGLDLILAPGLGFTREGHRLGRGKGYYDTFLAKCKASQSTPPNIIALAFKEQVLPEIPNDETDVRIDIVMTAE